MVKRIHIKTPSEHSIDLQHRAIEVQLEGCLNLDHSLIRPGPMSRTTMPAKLFVAILVDVGGPSEFFQGVLDTLEVDPEGKKPVEAKESIPAKKVSF